LFAEATSSMNDCSML